MNKLMRFAQMAMFPNLLQPEFEEVYQKNHPRKGQWHNEVFLNSNPIILELGCGKGEYTIGLAQRFPEKNFIGVDLKGARLWTGSSVALEKKMKNVFFLRTRIEFLDAMFDAGEVSEIWITFPDPQLHKQRKRLTSASFLNMYQKILAPNGNIHLKTDSIELHEFTLQMIELNNLPCSYATNDLYNSDANDDIRSIKTYYENRFLEMGKRITYIRFQLNANQVFVPLPKNLN